MRPRSTKRRPVAEMCQKIGTRRRCFIVGSNYAAADAARGEEAASTRERGCATWLSAHHGAATDPTAGRTRRPSPTARPRFLTVQAFQLLHLTALRRSAETFPKPNYAIPIQRFGRADKDRELSVNVECFQGYAPNRHVSDIVLRPASH